MEIFRVHNKTQNLLRTLFLNSCTRLLKILHLSQNCAAQNKKRPFPAFFTFKYTAGFSLKGQFCEEIANISKIVSSFYAVKSVTESYNMISLV